MQSYNPGIERERASAEFLEGLEDEDRKRDAKTLKDAAVIGTAILAWNVYRNHSGKRG